MESFFDFNGRSKPLPYKIYGNVPSDKSLVVETISLLCDIFDVSADYIICKSNRRRPEEAIAITNVQEKLLDAVKDFSHQNIEKLIEYAHLLRKADN